MLEIDGVRRSIETGGNFSLVDNLSDEYYDIIKWATMPTIDGIYRRAIQRRIDHFNQHGAYIKRLLEQNEVVWPGVSSAFESALDQVKTLAGLQG